MADLSTPARVIRERIFGIETQSEFAALLGYEPASISRFESGERRISTEFQMRVRELAQRRGVKWDNNWFFDAPNERRRRVA